MAHFKNLRDIGHRQAVFVCDTDCFIALGSQSLGQSAEVGVSTAVLLREGCESGACFWRVTLGARDPQMV